MKTATLIESPRRTRPDNLNDPALQAKLARLQQQLEGLRKLAS